MDYSGHIAFQERSSRKHQRNMRLERRMQRRTGDIRVLSNFRNLPEAIRQMIVDIWRAGIRARSVERQRPPPITLGLTHALWLRDNRVNGMWQWFARMGPGNNAVATVPGRGTNQTSTIGHSYAYGGNPAHHILTGHQDAALGQYSSNSNARLTHERDDWGTNLTDTFGNSLTKLIEYVLPRSAYDNWGTAEENAERLRLRGIRRVRWVDRMI